MNKLIKATSSVKASDKAAATTKPTHVKKKPSKYNIFFTIFVLAWTILVTAASQYLIAFPLHWILGEKILEPGWTLLYYVLVYLVTFGLLISLPPALIKTYYKKHKRNLDGRKVAQISDDIKSTPNSMGVQHLPTFIDIGLAPIGYVVYLFLATVFTSIMSVFTWFNVGQAQDIGFGYFITGFDRIMAILAVVVVAPIAEELIMRGWLYGKVRRKWSAPIAIVLVSLIFAVLHGQWNVGVTVFALSIVLCTLREITGTIWSGMILHMLSNAIAFYMLYIAI